MSELYSFVDVSDTRPRKQHHWPSVIVPRAAIDAEVERPVVRELVSLMEFRNSHPAFDIDGDMEVGVPSAGMLRIRRSSADGTAWAQLDCDLAGHSYAITHS